LGRAPGVGRDRSHGALLPSLAAAHPRHDPDGRAVPATAGVVQATPGSAATSPTIKTRNGVDETIDVSPTATTYVERGQTNASLSDVQAGDLVVVFGTLDGSTVTATQVIISPGHSGDPDRWQHGPTGSTGSTWHGAGPWWSRTDGQTGRQGQVGKRHSRRHGRRF
jgi:hypothetical protein